MGQVKLLTILMAIALIMANLQWWRRAANRKFGEQIIPPIVYAVLVISFLCLTEYTDLNVELLNGISLGIRNVSVIILIVYALTRKDHGQQ